MPIAALPPSTIKAIGCAQVLSDPASVVKELIDNALDARATAILVETAVNGLDVIQVRDNGLGIAPEDRAFVFRRYYTSKINGLSDLEAIGGTHFGFRGEALASAAEMSGGIVFTTRIAGESVATSLRVTRQGEILSQDCISHPIGTTVRVSDFLKYLPVRRQAALKSPPKTNSNIKAVLQAYAIAWPSVRFSLKVLKARNEKGNWTYAPKEHASMLDAARKVLDSAAVSQCKLYKWEPHISLSETSSPNATSDLQHNRSRFSIEALLPTPGCDLPLISHVGQYVAIDSRPVSCSRGVLKQFVDLYKSYLRSSNVTEGMTRIVEPILCVNIACPPGSYDPNIEPAKNDVLFTSSEDFLYIAECFFEHVYGKVRRVNHEKPKSKLHQPKGFEQLLNRQLYKVDSTEVPSKAARDGGSNHDQPAHSLTSLVSTDTHTSIPTDVVTPNVSVGSTSICSTILSNGKPLQSHDQPSSTDLVDLHTPKGRARRSAGQPNMYSIDSDDDFSFKEPGQPLEEPEDSIQAARNVSNPWSIAKMNSSIRLPSLRSENSNIIYSNDQLVTPARQAGDVGQTVHFPHSMPKPSEAFDGKILPTPHRSEPEISSSDRGSSLSPDRFIFPQRAWKNQETCRLVTAPQQDTLDRPSNGALDRWIQKIPSSGFISTRTLPTGTPLEIIADVSERPHRSLKREHNSQHEDQVDIRPSLVNDPQHVWFNVGRTPKSRPHVKAQPQLNFATVPQIRPDSEDERVLADKASRSVPLTDVMHPDLAITLDYESRKQAATLGVLKSRPRKIAKLPLETIPAHETTHDFVLRLNSSPQSIIYLAKKSSHCDEYISTGTLQLDGFARIIAFNESRLLENSLRDLMSNLFRMDRGQVRATTSFDLHAILQDHQITVGNCTSSVHT